MAKRTRFENKHGVSKHYSLFSWKLCKFCKKEFRRESGYKWLWGIDTYIYSCESCVASISHCNAMIEYQYAIVGAEMAGLPPPAPPMRTYQNK